MYPRRQYPSVVELYCGIRLFQILAPIVLVVLCLCLAAVCGVLNVFFDQATTAQIVADVALFGLVIVLPLSALTLAVLGLMRLCGVKPKAQRVAPRAPGLRVEPQLYGRRT